jgi:hypothetical protein
MVVGVSVARMGVGDVVGVGVGVDVSVSRVAVIVLVRVRWILDRRDDPTVDGSMSVWIS